MANNFKKFANSLWTSDPFAEIYQRTREHPMNSLAELKSPRIWNHNNVIFSYLNINSIRNKFDNLKLIIDEHIDILCVAESKIDNSFPTAQFSCLGYHKHKPYRLDISDSRGGLLVYLKSHLLSRRLTNYTTPKDIEIIPFELNLKKEKWMFISIYRPPSQNKQYFWENLSMIVDHDSPVLRSFMQSLNLVNKIKSNTCFKGNG